MKDIVLIVLCSCAAYYDIKYRRIPNKLIVTGLAAGTVLLFVGYGNISVSDVLGGMLLPIAAFGLFYINGLFGAGDIKLLSVCGMILGTKGIIELMIGSLYMAAIAIIVMRKRGKISFAPAVCAAAVLITVLSFSMSR